MSSTSDSKTVQVTVLVVFNDRKDPVLRVLEPVLLAIFLVITFSLNISLLVSITSSYSLRKVPYNILLVNLSVSCLLECLFNMMIALYYTIADSWTLGSVMCSVNTFAVQLVTLEVCFGILIFCIEGWLLVWRPSTYHNSLTARKQLVAIAILWVIGVLMCLPVVIGSIPSRLFPSRYACSSAGGDRTFMYTIFLTVCGYGISGVFIAASLLYLAVRKYKDYKARKSKNSDANFSDILFQGDLWTEWINIKLLLYNTLLCCIFEVPYIVINQISGAGNYRNPDPGNTTLPIIENTPKVETAITWFRYLFAFLFPIATFYLRKDIRKKFCSLFSCCHRTSTSYRSPRLLIKRNKSKRKNQDDLTPLSFRTPVLYISPDGLCLRQLDANNKVNNEETKFFTNTDSNWIVEPKFKTYLCDVANVHEETIGRSPLSIRRYSNESEISVIGLDRNATFGSLSPQLMMDVKGARELPNKVAPTTGYDTRDLIPKSKKCVRFCETVTIYQSMSSPCDTPSPSSNMFNEEERETPVPVKVFAGSRIPRKVAPENNGSPWKIDISKPHEVRKPSGKQRTVRTIVNNPLKKKNNNGYYNK